MDTHAFVAHAREHSFTAVQVQRQFPQLPLWVCTLLLAREAFIHCINPDGSVVIDDGQPETT